MEKDSLTDIRSLIRVSTAAKLINKTPVYVYQLAAEKIIDMIKIDSVCFVVVNTRLQKLIK